MRRTPLLFLILLPVLLNANPASQSQDKLFLTHVTVIDATGAAARPDMTVVIDGDRIAALGRSARTDVPDDAHVLDGTGKFLIPGLWDMHAHIAIYPFSMKETRLPLLIANGVTGVRDMYGDLEALQAWRREISAGTLLGPRIVAAGPILDGPGSTEFTVIRTAREGRQAVARIKRAGSDFVKVYSLLPRDAYFAIASEAKKRDIPFAGHVPMDVTVGEASHAGQKSVEHLYGMVLAASDDEAELMQEIARIPRGEPSRRRKLYNRIVLKAMESYSQAKAGRLFARLIENHTWQSPTLVVLRGMAFRDDPTVNDPEDPRLKYMAPGTLQWWDSFKDMPKERSANVKKIYRKRVELLGELHRAGVGILAGTDMGNPYCFPGFSLHEELELLVEAGLTPMEALQTATLNPARYLGREQDLGTIGVGKLADLLLLDADPLDDIRNSRTIHAVIVAGKLIDRPRLNALLAKVEAIQAGK